MSQRKWRDADPIKRSAQDSRARANALKRLRVALTDSSTSDDDETSDIWRSDSGDGTGVWSGTAVWIDIPGLNAWHQQYKGNWYSISDARARAAYARIVTDLTYGRRPYSVRYVGGPYSGQDSELFLTPDNFLLTTHHETDFGQYEYQQIDNGVHIYEWVPTPEPAERDFYAEEIVGWREWKLVVDESATITTPVATSIPVYQLSAISSTARWPAYQPMRAECNRELTMWCGVEDYKEDAHVVPEWNCDCGIHAYKEKSSVDGSWIVNGLVRVYGQVSLWGKKIVVGEKGYRAEFAYPRHLYLRESFHSSVEVRTIVAAQVSETYGVPCECE